MEVEGRRKLHVGDRIILHGVYLMNLYLGWRISRLLSGGHGGAPTGTWGKAARSQLCLAGSQGRLSWLRAGGGWQLSMIRNCLLLLSFPEKHQASVTLVTEQAMKHKATLRLIFSPLFSFSFGGFLLVAKGMGVAGWPLFKTNSLYDTTLLSHLLSADRGSNKQSLYQGNSSGKWSTWGSPSSTLHSCPQRTVFNHPFCCSLKQMPEKKVLVYTYCLSQESRE